MVGRLYGLPKAEARKRSGEILERFGLSDATDRQAKTYSGGMRRRLDVASSLVGRPDILFLDEPTTGLDPRSRVDVWAFVRELQADGTTILLTTQYLEEADQLADQITVVDVGKIIAEGTSDQLKDQIGGEVLELTVEDTAQTWAAAEALQGIGTGAPNVDVDEGRIRVPVGNEGAEALRDSSAGSTNRRSSSPGSPCIARRSTTCSWRSPGTPQRTGSEPEPSNRRSEAVAAGRRRHERDGRPITHHAPSAVDRRRPHLACRSTTA